MTPEGSNNLNLVQWYVDRSFAVHSDMMSYTGITIILGKGAAIDQLVKQKLNTKSLIEAEVCSTMVVPDLLGYLIYEK